MTREEAIERLKTDIYKYADFTENPNENEFWMAFDSAIKALEQEPTTKNDLGVDCVARQDIERYIEGFINEYTPKEELEFINLELDGLKHLPSITPQEPRWIPVSERLPASDEDVLITNGFGIYVGWIDPTDKRWRADSESEYFMDDIVAWMPLPDPYRAESEPQKSEEI